MNFGASQTRRRLKVVMSCQSRWRTLLPRLEAESFAQRCEQRVTCMELFLDFHSENCLRDNHPLPDLFRQYAMYLSPTNERKEARTMSAIIESRTPSCDLDLSKLEDESLVGMAQSGNEPARNELIERLWPHCQRFVRRQALRWGFQNPDLQDAQQDAVLWIIDAIGHYRCEECVRPNGCQFRSFLYCVLRHRFIDALRTGRKYHFRNGANFKHLPREFETGNSESLARLTICDAVTANGNVPYDGQLSEWSTQLQDAVGRLSQRSQELCSLLRQGYPLRRIATRLRCSYDQAKRMRRKLLATLGTAVSTQEL